MKIIHEVLSLDELKQIAAAAFGDFVKAVVDIEKGELAIDAELHYHWWKPLPLVVV